MSIPQCLYKAGLSAVVCLLIIQSSAKCQTQDNAVKEYGLGPLVDMLNESAKASVAPGKHEAALAAADSLRYAEFAGVFKKGESVPAYVVQDKEGHVQGIYPRSTNPMESTARIGTGETSIRETTIKGTGDFYRPVETAIVPTSPNHLSAEANFDRFVNERVAEHLSSDQVRAFRQWVGETFAPGAATQLGAPLPAGSKGILAKGVKIFFDDRLLAQALGVNGGTATANDLVGLGQVLLASSDDAQMDRAFRGFANQQKARLVAQRPRIRLNQPVLISLRSVLSSLTVAKNDMALAGPESKSLGGITRINGYVWDRQADDIVLVGDVDANVEPIGLDNLLVALRSVWKDGNTPVVSLDPDPDMPRGGPNHSRVIGIPQDSRFARVMLDADYLMKLITDGIEPVSVSQFRSLKTILSTGTGKLTYSRFWFVPTQPSEGDIEVSSQEDIVLFTTGVELQTEALRLVNGGSVVGLGTQESGAVEVAHEMNEYFSSIEREKPIFRQLHGLFDVVLLCKVLREMGVQSSMLTTLANIPLAHWEVPETYPFAMVTFVAPDHQVHALGGGVTTQSHFGAREEIHYDDQPFDKLRILAHQLTEQHAVAMSIKGFDLEVVQPTQGSGAFDGAYKAFQEAVNLYSTNDVERAIGALDRSITLDGEFAEAFALRAVCRWQVHDLKGTQQDLAEATALAPRDDTIRTTAIQLYLAMGEDSTIDREDQMTRASVASVYYETAVALWSGSHDRRGASAACQRAIQLNPEYADAYELRAALRIEENDMKGAASDATEALRLRGNSGEAYRLRGIARLRSQDNESAYDDFTEAIKLSPQVSDNYCNRSAILKQWGSSDASERDMAMCWALEVDEYTRLLQKQPNNPALYLERGMAKLDAHMIASAVDDFSAAVNKDPQNAALAYVLRSEALHTLQRDQEAWSDASRAVELDREYALAYAERASADIGLGHPDEAIQDCTTAISKDPKLARGYFLRGYAKFSKGDNAGAIDDLQRAFQLDTDPNNRDLYKSLIDKARGAG
jgi:tetratricopeptide (TPR) repeat protein